MGVYAKLSTDYLIKIRTMLEEDLANAYYKVDHPAIRESLSRLNSILDERQHMSITDSDMVSQLMERMGVGYERAFDVVDAIVKVHGRVSVYSLSPSDLVKAGRLADNLKAANESN